MADEIDQMSPPSLGAEEEIIEKKPSAPMALALLMITFVVLIVGTYLSWSQLSNMYFKPKDYESGKDANDYYTKFKDSMPRPSGTKPYAPDLGGPEPLDDDDDTP